MKIVTYSVFFLCMLFYLTGSSQSIEKSVDLYGANFPQEKIHIHFDKEVYLPGETIWFKAYIFEENLPSERSTNFYASLYDEDGKLIQQQLSPIFNSTTDGHFDIPDSLQSKQLFCRAYTTWMMNFDTSFLFVKAIKLINSRVKGENERGDKTVSLHFFPEGGDMIEGTRNTIAFKANYNNGLPFEISGVIKKQETGEVLLPLKSLHDGMGRFDIEVQAGERYYAEWVDDKGNRQQTWLPVAKPEGVSLKLAQQQGRLIFNIVNRLQGDSLHVLIYMYQKVFYKTDLAVNSKEPYTGVVNTGSLPTGTMAITVFDAGWHPMAERVAFINNRNYKPDITVVNKEINMRTRGKNVIEIKAGDTALTNMSLSITDADLNDEDTHSTIITNLLLGGDIKGYVHEPAYYFSDDTAAALRAELDLVMLTHGWRRYNWNNMLEGKMPVNNYQPDDYLGAHGQVSKALMPEMPKEEFVNLIVKTKDSTNIFYSLLPDSTGLLKQTGLVFYDTAKILFSFNKNKLWNTKMAFSNSNYTYPQPSRINNYNEYSVPDTTGYTKYGGVISVFQYYTKNNGIKEFNKEKTLSNVIVKGGAPHGWRNDPLLKMDEKYTNMFRGIGALNWAFDLVHDETVSSKLDIYNYLMGKIPGLVIDYKRSRKSFGIMVFLDESEIDEETLKTINLEDIAYVKYYKYTPWRPGLPQSLCIYLKKGDDLIDRRPKDTDLGMVKVAGYSPIKEFYSPDYSQNNTGTGTDARTTLLWMPYILTDANNRTVPISFYNNDLSKRFRVVLEGINDEGKMIHIEKIIE